MAGCEATEMPLTNAQRVARDRRFRNRDISLPEAEITGIFISLMGPDVKALSVVECHVPYSHSRTNGTVLDPYMGNINRKFDCPTCGKNFLECPNHPGYINLGKNLFDPIAFPYIALVANSICHNCGKVALKPNQEEAQGIKRLKGIARLNRIHELVSKSGKFCTCPPNLRGGLIKKSEDLGFCIEGKNRRVITPKELLDVFEKVSDEDAKMLGFFDKSHPRNFVRNRQYVSPIAARPPAVIAGKPQEHAMTKLFNDMVIDSMNASVNEDSAEKLHNKVREIISNKEKKGFNKKDTPSVREMLNGKKGIFRACLMGKRGKFAARSVAICCAMLAFGEFGYSEEVAKHMTIPEKTTMYNIDYILNLFGDTYEKCVVTDYIPGSGDDKGFRFAVTPEKWEYIKSRIQPGDEIYRHLRDGDPALANRQPTIGSSSMMGMTIRLIPGNVFGAHMCYTTPYNLDFDGDELNVHTPQSSASKIDSLFLANARHRIMDFNTNGANFGIVYNGASSGYILTKDDLMLDEELWMKGYEIAGKQQGEVDSAEFKDFVSRCQEHNISPLSGKALFSSLFPADFWFKKGSLRIKKGIIYQGRVTKSANGRSRNVILQSLFHQYGREVCSNYLTYCQWLLDWYLRFYGLSITYSDCSMDWEKLREFLEFKKEKVRSLNEKINLLISDSRDATEIEKMFTEEQIYEYIRSTSTLINREGVKEFSKKEDNPLNIMTSSGAKGSGDNVSQILSLVGQQLIYGQRPAKIISDGKRSTPLFEADDNSVQAQGYCIHSLSEGLEPEELFFYSMSSRVGLLDTGVNVSTTGAMQRRIIKVCEDQKIQSGGEVVNTAGIVYSYQLMSNFNPRYEISTPGLLSFINLEEVSGKLSQ